MRVLSKSDDSVTVELSRAQAGFIGAALELALSAGAVNQEQDDVMNLDFQQKLLEIIEEFRKVTD